MEGSSNWKPNQQGGDSHASNNTNDWRSQLEPDMRKKIIFAIVEKLKKCYPTHTPNELRNAALTFEGKIYDTAADKGDYMRRIKDYVMAFERKIRIMQSNNVQSSSSLNGTDAPAPAQGLNQGQPLPTSLPYAQTPTSQQWLPQNNNQINLTAPESSGLRTEVSINVSAAQNLNIHMGEGAHLNILPGSQRQIHGREQLLPQQQSSNYLQNQQAQQQQHHQPIQQQLPHQTTLSSIQQNSQFLPRHHQQRFHSTQHQQQMSVPSQEQKREQLISQLMNDEDTQQSHLTPRQNKRDQQGAFRVSSSQQNNLATFQERPQQNNNIQNTHQQQQQRLYSHSNNAPTLPSQQQQYIPSGQSSNYNVHGSSLLATQGQEMRQSQPMTQQQHQPQHLLQQQQTQNKILQQPLGSLRPDQHNQTYQFQRTSPANPSTSQDSTGKTVNATGGDWEEETYQKITALKDKYIHVLSKLYQRLSDKLLEIDSLPEEKKQHGHIEKLSVTIKILKQVLVFLSVNRSSISESHRDRFSVYEEHVLKFVKPHQIVTQRPMQQQVHLPPSQTHQATLQPQSGHQAHVLQSLDNKDQMYPRSVMPSGQNGASSSVSGLTMSHTAMPHPLQSRERNNMTSSGHVALPSLKHNPASNQQTGQPSMFQHHPPMQQRPQQKQKQQPQANHQLQLQKPINEMNDVRTRQGVNIKAGLVQQHVSTSRNHLEKPMASPVQVSNVSPSETHNYSSPQLVDQHTTVNKTGTSSQSCVSPLAAPSPVTSFAPSPKEPEKPISLESHVAQEHPPSTLSPEPNTERPIDRLIKAFQSSSPESLAQSVSEMSSVISLTDRLAGSVNSIGGSRARLAEDLTERTRLRLHQEETNPNKRFKRSITSLPRDIITSETNSYKQLSSLESEVDSTASSGSKAHKIEPGYALLQEIMEVNKRHVETVVDICNEEVSPSEVTTGTIVTCSYAPVAISASFKALYKSGHISQIQPLRLLVPTSYPHSPILLENMSSEASVHKHEDLSARTRARFGLSMKEFTEPMSLREIAKAWDECARATMIEYAERHGGGTFSSKYGRWESVLRAS